MLCRFLGLLCFIKLAIFTMILLDLPFPAILDKTVDQVEKSAPITHQAVHEVRSTEIHELPQPPKLEGSQAANVAGNLPKKPTMPTPVIASKPYRPILNEPVQTTVMSGPNLPLPNPLPAPIAEPGIPAPQEKQTNVIPVPTLGAATAANAAADMPLPQRPPTEHAFAPAEQQLPLQNAMQESAHPSSPQPPLAKENSMPVPSMQQSALTPLQMNTASIELERQQQDMLVLKKQMDDRLKELQDSEAKVKQMLEEAKNIEAQKLKTLIMMYANMKPKTAAKALENMDEHTACQILQGMTPKQSGDILSYTNPEVTAKLSEMLTHLRIK